MRACVTVAIVMATATTAAAQAVDDDKLWSEATGAVDVTDSTRASVSEQLRSGADSGFDQARTELTLGVRANPYLSFAGLYVLMLRDGDPRIGTVDETRHRIAGDAAVHYELDRLSLSNRVRLQYTTYQFDDDHIHVRDKIRGGFDATKHVTPYAALEFFYLLSPKSEYRETRFYLGVDWRVKKRLELGAFFLRQVETNVQMPEHNNILGLELSYLVYKIKKHKAAPTDHD